MPCINEKKVGLISNLLCFKRNYFPVDELTEQVALRKGVVLVFNANLFFTVKNKTCYLTFKLGSILKGITFSKFYYFII